MLILLPPSETKRDGGQHGSKLRISDLRYPQLRSIRRTTVNAVRTLAHDVDGTVAALKLGPTQRGEAAHNRVVTRSATMPAVDRYTGVLFDALDAASLSDDAREYLGEHVVIHSAILGPIGALDAIPAYRLSHDSRVPGLALKKVWARPVSAALASETGPLLDARSEAYAQLGPAPAHPQSVFLRVISVDGDGRRRALNHFNKQAKGRLVRALAQTEARIGSIDDLIGWGARNGFRLALGEGNGPGGLTELELTV